MTAPLALVTGGCGFVGRHLVDALRARGWRVRVLDPAVESAWPQRWEHAEDVTGIQASVLDEEAVVAALAGVRWCFHLAAIAHLYRRDRSDYERVNHTGTATLLRAARQAAGLERVVVTASEAVFGDRQRAASVSVITEHTPWPALADLPGPYTRSKLRAVLAAEEAGAAGLPVTIVVPTTPIGPGDVNRTPPTRLIADCLDRRLPAYLDCELDCIDVRDVAAVHVAACEHGRAGRRYLAAGTGIALGDLLARIGTAGGVEPPRRRVPPWLASLAAHVGERWARCLGSGPPAASIEGVRLARAAMRFDASESRRELGWEPRPLDEAIAAAVAWLREHPAA